MTDDAMLRQQAITGEVPTSDSAFSDIAGKTEAQIEECIENNKGMIMNCLSGLSGPMLTTARWAVKAMIVPVDWLLTLLSTLQLTKISKTLRSFADNDKTCPPSQPLTTSSDCNSCTIM